MIGLAVVATTLTICAVFIPVAFMGGIAGEFFGGLGLLLGFLTRGDRTADVRQRAR